MHSLGAQCPRLARAVASGHTKDAGALVINERKLAWVQIVADAFQDILHAFVGFHKEAKQR